MANFPKLDFSTIQMVDFSQEQYYPEETVKTQVCLHHTASGRGVDGDWRHWLSNTERVATCVIVGHDGVIHQLYSSKYWGHHLGVQQSSFDLHGIKDSNNKRLNMTCIGIEIDSWGPLTLIDGEFKSYTGAKVPKEEVQEYTSPFKGFHHYQKYTEAQILAVAQLLEYWHEVYDIPLTYNENMWKLSLEALRGKSGVWTHVSYREDKSDCHPQPELITMLKSLTV